MPEITVIMPAYQAAGTIGKAIASVQSQTFPDWELIVVDDGSTDATAEIAENVAVADRRIRVLRLPSNCGTSAAKNVGWRASSAPLVAILDADDEARPCRLEMQREFMSRRPEVHVLGGAADFIDPKGEFIRTVRLPRQHEELARARWRHAPFVHSTVMMRREFLERTGGYPEDMQLAEDYDLWMRGFAIGGVGYHNLEEVLVVYRSRRVQRWKMICASAAARRKAGRREQKSFRGGLACGWILLNGALEQSRLFVLRDRLKEKYQRKPIFPRSKESAAGMRRLRVAFVTSSMGGGGAERVLTAMANHWAERDWTVTVFTLRADEAATTYPVHERVRVRRLNLIHEHNPVFNVGHGSRLWTLRRALRSEAPDVVISFLSKLNVAVLIALTGTGIRTIATEHLVPWQHPMGVVWETLRRLVYRRAARVICPNTPIRDYLAARIPGCYATLAYPAQLLLGSSPPMANRQPLIFAAGRLAPEKGYDVLIAAFALVRDQFPEWRLEIAGEGPLRAALAEQIKVAGLTDAVELRGHLATARERMQEAAIFVLASRNEAFPMVLCEAMAAGAAVIATDCPTGPREMMADGVDGLLVPPDNAPALAAAMRRLMADLELREKLAGAASASARRFGAEAVMPQWDALVRDVCYSKS